MGSKGGHLHPPKEDARKEDGPFERRTNLPKGGRLATLIANTVRALARVKIVFTGPIWCGQSANASNTPRALMFQKLQ